MEKGLSPRAGHGRTAEKSWEMALYSRRSIRRNFSFSGLRRPASLQSEKKQAP